MSIDNKTVETHLAYLGRCIQDRKDLGLGYCGSAPFKAHANIMSKDHWPLWINIAKEAISDMENIEDSLEVKSLWGDLDKLCEAGIGPGKDLNVIVGKPVTRLYYLMCSNYFDDDTEVFSTFVKSSNSYTHLLEYALSLGEDGCEIWAVGETPVKVYPKS